MQNLRIVKRYTKLAFFADFCKFSYREGVLTGTMRHSDRHHL